LKNQARRQREIVRSCSREPAQVQKSSMMSKLSSPDLVKILDDASVIDLGFPQELYAKEFPRALRYGGMRDQIAA